MVAPKTPRWELMDPEEKKSQKNQIPVPFEKNQMLFWWFRQMRRRCVEIWRRDVSDPGRDGVTRHCCKCMLINSAAANVVEIKAIKSIESRGNKGEFKHKQRL